MFFIRKTLSFTHLNEERDNILLDSLSYTSSYISLIFTIQSTFIFSTLNLVPFKLCHLFC